MPLEGPLGVLFLSGLALLGAGFALIWTSLGKHGGLSKARTVAVLFDEDSPMRQPSARGDRRRLRAGVFLMGFGVMNVFAAFTVGEPRERGLCVRACHKEGYRGGSFAPSTKEFGPDGKPMRGCFCAGPAGSIEITPPRMPAIVPPEDGR
jgi:hypothetical protein